MNTHRLTSKALAGVLAAALMVAASAASAGLTNRWSFSENGGAGTTLADPIGGADATIVDQGANNGDVGQTYAGQVYLAGGGKGDTDYVKFQNGTFSALTADATIETWATTYSAQNWSRVFSLGSTSDDVFMSSWTRGTDQNQDQVRWRDTGVPGDQDNTIDDSIAPYEYGTQYHLVYTIDADGGADGKALVKWYKDGVLKGAFDTNNKLSDLNDIESVLGRSKWPDNTANASWNEFRLYDQALTQNQVVYNRDQGPDVPTVNIVAPAPLPLGDWRFNTDDDGNPVSDGQLIAGGSANVANLRDETGNGFRGHQGRGWDSPGPHYRAYDPAELAGRAGVADGFALSTGGGAPQIQEGYIYFDGDLDLATNGDFSVWGRIKRLSDASADDEYIFSRPGRWDLSVNSGGQLDFDVGGLSGNTGQAINMDQWYDVALVFDNEPGAGSDQVTIYIDGTAYGPYGGTAAFDGADWFHIGAGPGGGADFHGLFDRVIFWDQAVDAATVAGLTREQPEEAIPEPGTMLAALAGLSGLGAYVRRRRR